ncbi:hypothetical protein FOC29_20140 [Burkholderia vietnamiensis]|uniref:hypothetical protein n=1 Tax=Burkholderia vietnamiensis TaxID=60552 RepID=UPI001EE562E0|nr:hypothetical protein [Burkholderia vietnamiensis]UKV76644.1 hypothetical protein FOC29_20140 [Burkholderia vietnamiensis]
MSAVDTRGVPCNFLSWPSIVNLLPDQKFIGTYLFFCPDANACGCFFFSRPRAAADLSLSVDALDEALREFERRKLVLLDRETGEIFVLDWPRWRNFKTPAARGALWASIDRIKSPRLPTFVKKAYKSIPRPGKGGEMERGLPPSSVNGGDAPDSSFELPYGWWRDPEKTRVAGQQLELEAKIGESMAEFRDRIRAAIAGGHAQRKRKKPN